MMRPEANYKAATEAAFPLKLRHSAKCVCVARGVGQSNLLTLPSASTCHAGPKLQVTVWQGVMTKLIIRMALGEKRRDYL